MESNDHLGCRARALRQADPRAIGALSLLWKHFACRYQANSSTLRRGATARRGMHRNQPSQLGLSLLRYCQQSHDGCVTERNKCAGCERCVTPPDKKRPWPKAERELQTEPKSKARYLHAPSWHTERVVTPLIRLIRHAEPFACVRNCRCSQVRQSVRLATDS